MSSQPKHFVTVGEYLQFEETALDRHEYVNGEMFAMAGGTANHALLASRIIIEIGSQLRGSGCRVRGADMRLRTAPDGLYSYPDVVVSCQPESVEKNTLLNPLLIVEVLSESTQDYDRGAKFERYRHIASFREYLVVAQDRVYVEHHVRREEYSHAVWTMRESTSLSDVIDLIAVPARLALAAVYDGVDFESA